MKVLLIVSLSFFIAACSDVPIEQVVFKETMETELIEQCESDNECVSAVKSQIQACMDKADFTEIIENSESEAHTAAFQKKFLPCFKNAKGVSYWPIEAVEAALPKS